MRGLIVRKGRPHPGAQLRITDADGLRLTCFATNTADAPIAALERPSVIGSPQLLENELDEDILDESRTYFEELEISDELLAGIEGLCFDAGLDIYYHCAPAWGGEDDLFDVHSLDDLALLPNLRWVTAVDDGTLARKQDRRGLLAARGITAS